MLKTVSKTEAQVTRAQWCSNHMQHIGRLSHATCEISIGQESSSCFTDWIRTTLTLEGIKALLMDLIQFYRVSSLSVSDWLSVCMLSFDKIATFACNVYFSVTVLYNCQSKLVFEIDFHVAEMLSNRLTNTAHFSKLTLFCWLFCLFVCFLCGYSTFCSKQTFKSCSRWQWLLKICCCSRLTVIT